MSGRYAVPDVTQDSPQPGSRGRVLANRLGLVRVRDLQQAESAALLGLLDTLLDEVAENQSFSTDDITSYHRRWLGEIYAWAGRYRQVNMAKGGFQFASAHLIPGLMQNFEREILAQETPCAGMSAPRLLQALARTHAEFILIHPFREGNGRLARLLNTLMALQAGFPALDYGSIRGAQKQHYIAAIQAALERNYAPLTGVFERVLKRTLRGATA